MSIPLNKAIANPGLKDLLDALKKDIMVSLNCHAIATVQSFSQNADNKLSLITATMNYSKTYFERQADGSYQAKQVDYPILVDCPAIILGGGNTALTFPIAKGDQCLILFNDRDIDNWFAGANAGPVASSRLHSFADAMALVGFQKVTTYDSDHALLSNGNAQLGVPATTAGAAGARVRIANNTTTLYTLLANLITAIEGITVSPGSFTAGGDPVVGTSGTVSSTAALESAKTALRALLE